MQGTVSAPPDQGQLAPLVRKSDLVRLLNVGVRTLDRLQSLGALPTPDVYVGCSPRWTVTTVRAWLDSKPRLPGRAEGDA